MLNSLDARYGSTYRLRALAKLLETIPDCSVRYIETNGSALKKLKSALIESSKSYDIILTQKFNPITLSALLISGLKNIPAIVDWDDFDVGLQDNVFKKWLAHTCEAWGLPLASIITTHSQLIAEVASLKKKVFLIPQGFDPTLFFPDKGLRSVARRDLGFLDSDFVIGHLCTFTSGGALDLDVILNAFSEVESPEAKFVLIGGGPLEHLVR